MDDIRRFTCLTFDAECDRYFLPIDFQPGGAYAREFCRMLEPVPPRKDWWPVFQDMKKDLHIELNDDGSVATRQLKDLTLEMIAAHREKGMLLDGAGLTVKASRLIYLKLITYILGASTLLLPGGLQD